MIVHQSAGKLRLIETFLPLKNRILQNFSLIPNLEIVKRTWDGECAVYLGKSRETHLLSAPCAYLLGILDQGPVPFEVLKDRLQSFAGDADAQDVSDLTHEIVSTLAEIGVIEVLGDAS